MLLWPGYPLLSWSHYRFSAPLPSPQSIDRRHNASIDNSWCRISRLVFYHSRHGDKGHVEFRAQSFFFLFRPYTFSLWSPPLPAGDIASLWQPPSDPFCSLTIATAMPGENQGRNFLFLIEIIKLFINLMFNVFWSWHAFGSQVEEISYTGMGIY